MEKQERKISETKPQFAIFDKLFSLPIIRLFKPLYEWKRSFWIYCFLGFLSTASDFGISAILKTFIQTATIVTAISFCFSTLFSFILFRYFYFDRTNKTFINEFLLFIPTRLFTFCVGEVMMLVFVDLLSFNFWIIKIISIPITAGLNYITSKLFVFKNKK